MGPRPQPPPCRFWVASWLVDRRACCLIRDGQEVHLRPMLVELLAFLAERAGQVVTKEEILDRIWSSRFVSESALTRSIAELRSYLGDSKETPLFIETIPKRGYRLIAHVDLGPSVSREGLPSVTQALLAILPFENLSGDPEQEYFSDGMTEEIITQLGSVQPENLGVIARTSVMRYKHTTQSLEEIAAELRAQFVLEGSVRRDGSRVRITAQLIQVADQTHLWAESYDEEFAQILEVQSKVAEAICAAIQVRIPESEKRRLSRSRLVNPAAHEAYLKGLYYWNKFTPQAAAKAIRHLQQAITIDSQHGRAHAALAQVFGMMGYWGLAPPSEVNPLARAEAQKALEIDASLAVAHGALACVLCLHDWEFKAGEEELQRAIELNPSEATNHLWYALYHAILGHAEQANSEAVVASRLDPWAPLTGLIVSSVYLFIDDFGRAIERAQAIVEVFPESHLAYRVLGLAYLGETLFEHAIAALQKGVALARDPVSVALLAEAFGLSGQNSRARALIDELQERSRTEYVLPTAMAWAYAGAGDFDTAFRWLETAFEEHVSTLLWLRAGPMFDPLRADPRFTALLSRLRLPS